MVRPTKEGVLLSCDVVANWVWLKEAYCDENSATAIWGQNLY